MSGKERSIIKFIPLAAAALVCVVIFIIFGTRSRKPVLPSGDPTPLPTVTPLPGGIMLEAMTEALENGLSGLAAVGVPARLSEGGFISVLEMDNRNDSGVLFLFTDGLGRIERMELRIGYLYADTGTVGGAALETILAEYARREKFDKELIEAYLRSVIEPWSRELDIGAADLSKLISAVLTAYEKQDACSKKLGSAKLSAATERTDTRAEFILDISFDPDKMK